MCHRHNPFLYCVCLIIHTQSFTEQKYLLPFGGWQKLAMGRTIERPNRWMLSNFTLWWPTMGFVSSWVVLISPSKYQVIIVKYWSTWVISSDVRKPTDRPTQQINVSNHDLFVIGFGIRKSMKGYYIACFICMLSLNIYALRFDYAMT